MYEEEGGSKARLFIALGLGVVVMAAIAFFVILKKPSAAKAPTKFSTYVAADKAFACQTPDGWRREEAVGGAGTLSRVTVTQGRARIRITSDLEGSLLADMSRSPSGMAGMDGALPGGMRMSAEMRKPPVEKLHDMGKKDMEENWKEYEESKANPFPCPLGEARVSEWTGKGGTFGNSKMHGLRATILSGERRTRVTCSCPEEDWNTLRPAFSTVLRSIQRGGG
jgi:hypothetical protein